MVFCFHAYKLFAPCASHDNLYNTVIPLLRDHKMSLQKWSLKRDLPYYPCPCGQRVQYLVCVCVCLCYYKLLSKSKLATSHKLGNLKQKVVLYKAGKFLQANVAEVACKFQKQEKLTVQIIHERYLNLVKGIFYLKLKEIM